MTSSHPFPVFCESVSAIGHISLAMFSLFMCLVETSQHGSNIELLPPCNMYSWDLTYKMQCLISAFKCCVLKMASCYIWAFSLFRPSEPMVLSGDPAVTTSVMFGPWCVHLKMFGQKIWWTLSPMVVSSPQFVNGRCGPFFHNTSIAYVWMNTYPIMSDNNNAATNQTHWKMHDQSLINFKIYGFCMASVRFLWTKRPMFALLSVLQFSFVHRKKHQLRLLPASYLPSQATPTYPQRWLKWK